MRSIPLCKNSDILHCNDLNTLPIGVIVKLFFNKKVKIVYDAHEYEINDRPNEGKMSIRLKYLLEKALIRYADRVITVSNAIAKEYVRLYNIPKPAVVLNTPPYREIEKKDLFRGRFGIAGECPIFLYQGGLSKGRGIEILIDAFKALHDEGGDTIPAIVFMGYGPLEEEIEEISKKYKNIYFHPAVSPDVLLEYTGSADFGISLIEDVCLSYRYSLPNKMFEYLMADLPVIVSDLPEMRQVIEENKVGVIARENSPESLKEAIEEVMRLDRDVLQKNIQEVKKIYNWEAQEKVLLGVYEGLKE
jgi:glycosyltransferase involved in cell wall biosynthesis